MEQNVNRTANHCTGRIPLEGLPNTRDLGGIRTMEGKKILPARLIRSGALYEATPADLERLVGEWRLGTVVDFRTAVERSQKPDPDMDGVTNIFNPKAEAGCHPRNAGTRLFSGRRSGALCG